MRFWFNSAYSGNDHCSLHSQNSCLRELRALENWDQLPELLFPSGAEAATQPGTISHLPAFASAVFSQRGLLPHPWFTCLTPAHFSKFFCYHLLQVRLNFLCHVSSKQFLPNCPELRLCISLCCNTQYTCNCLFRG